MDFNVSQLLREPSGSVRRFEVSDDFEARDGAETMTLQGSVSLLRTDRGIWVSAELETQARCECSRCLTDYEQPVAMKVEEEFFPLIDPVSGAVVDVPHAVEDSFRIDNNHILNLDEAVREYFALSIPMKPVCGANCVGLCPTCGVNLNLAGCGCDNEARDPRWGPLLDAVEAGNVSVN